MLTKFSFFKFLWSHYASAFGYFERYFYEISFFSTFAGFYALLNLFIAYFNLFFYFFVIYRSYFYFYRSGSNLVLFIDFIPFYKSKRISRQAFLVFGSSGGKFVIPSGAYIPLYSLEMESTTRRTTSFLSVWQSIFIKS